MNSRANFCISVSVLLSLCLSCVSVELGKGKVKQASDVRFSAPSSPFEAAKDENADEYWLNPKNGSSISYRSQCSDTSDPSLENLLSASVANMGKVNFLKKENVIFNQRAALKSEMDAAVDGIDVRINLIIFKKNNCSYTLNYIALKDQYERDASQFQRFAGSFEAP